MATKRKGVSKSRITTRSSKANALPEFISTVTRETASSPERKSSTNGQFNDVFEDDGCGWSTPKAKRFRIPEIENCPPAPKKQRATNGSDCSSGGGGDDDFVKCSLRVRSSIPFFKPPHELAEFFFGSVSPFHTCPQFEAS